MTLFFSFLSVGVGSDWSITDSVLETNQILLLVWIWEPGTTSLCKDMALCTSTLLCSSIRRVTNLSLFLLIFISWWKAVWVFVALSRGQAKRLFCKSSIVFASLIHITVAVVGLAAAKKCSHVLNANHCSDTTDLKPFQEDDPFLLKWFTVGRTKATTFTCIGFQNVFCWSYLSWFNLFNKLQHGSILQFPYYCVNCLSCHIEEKGALKALISQISLKFFVFCVDF